MKSSFQLLQWLVLVIGLSAKMAMAAPTTPNAPAATDGTYAGAVEVTWPNILGVTTYNLYRCSTTSTLSCSKPIYSAKPTCTIKGCGSSRYIDSYANAGLLYYYRLIACDSSGSCSGYSTPLCQDRCPVFFSFI